MAKQQLIKIAGVDVSAKVISEKTEYLYQEMVDAAVIELRFDVNQVLTIESFQEVNIWENFSGTLETNANRKFNGNIAKIERDVGKIKITCYSFLWKAIQSEVNQTFDVNIDTEAGVGSELFITLAGLANITADSSSVQDTTPTGIVLDKFVCNRAEIFERMQTLADIYGYQFFERYDTLKLHFEPLGFEENSNIIQIGGTGNNVQEFPKWREDATKIFNKVEIIGAFQESNLQEKFNGDAAETQFTLTKVPEIVEVIVDGVTQAGGIEGSTSGFDYSVDKSNKQINFEVASTPGAGANNVVVNYSVREPTPVILDNETSISDLGRTIKQKFTFNDIQSVDDAERRAENLLAVYSSPFISTKIKMSPEVVESFDLLVGQSVRVIDNRQLIDRIMVIKKIVTRWPESDVEIEVGDEEIKTTSFAWDSTIRLRRLEEELSRIGDIVRVVKTPKHTLIIDRRDLDVSQEEYDTNSDSLILGLGTADGFPALGTGLLGSHDDAFLASVNHTINQGNNIYDEDFNDTVYKAAATTATWTGSGSATFTSGQLIQSSSIDKNNGTVLTALLTSTEVSGSFDYEMTADYLAPISQYKMNDNAATTVVLDNEGNYNGVSNANTDTMDVAGKINNAIEFNGTTDLITISSNDPISATNGLISCWVKFNAISKDQTIFISGEVDADGETNSEDQLFIRLRGADDKIEAGWITNNEPDLAVSNDAVSTGSFIHIMLRWSLSENKVRLFVNNVEQSIGDVLTNDNKSNWINEMRIGRSMGSAANTNYFDGVIDDFRIYDIALSSTQRDFIYNSASGTEESANWETVTSNVKHIFTNSGTDIRFRATEAGASTGEISNIKIEDYH